MRVKLILSHTFIGLALIFSNSLLLLALIKCEMAIHEIVKIQVQFNVQLKKGMTECFYHLLVRPGPEHSPSYFIYCVCALYFSFSYSYKHSCAVYLLFSSMFIDVHSCIRHSYSASVVSFCYYC